MGGGGGKAGCCKLVNMGRRRTAAHYDTIFRGAMLGLKPGLNTIISGPLVRQTGGNSVYYNVGRPSAEAQSNLQRAAPKHLHLPKLVKFSVPRQNRD